MVEYQATLDRTFTALGDATRRAILSRLARGPMTVTAVAVPFAMSLAAVSKHLRTLEAAGLVRREVRGREHHLSLEAAPLREAARWTERYRAFWEARMDALDAYLRERKPRERKRGPR